MTEFPDYYKATNAAYDTLIEYKEFSFPISPIKIIRQLDRVALHTYYDLTERRGFPRGPFIDFFASSEHGFTVKSKEHYVIYYNEQKDETTKRFTLAHELGHIILGHTQDNEKENKEANCFARNLLCPIPAVEGFKVITSDEYQQLFCVSEPMADVARCHASSDKYYITSKNYNNFNDRVICDLYGISMAELYGLPKEYNELFA